MTVTRSTTRFPERRQIAVLVQTANDWSRQILLGVGQYAIEQGGWEFYVEPRGFYEEFSLPDTWNGHGLICRLTSEKLSAEIQRRKIPAVNISWLADHQPYAPKVISGEEHCGQLAANFFLEKGFEHFGFVGGAPSLGYSRRTVDAYAQTLRESNISSIHVFEYGPSDGSPHIRAQRQRLKEWIKDVPKPIALLVWSDIIGHELTLICSSIHVDVPHDIAILAIEHDPLISMLSPIPISSIDHQFQKIGRMSAEILDRMIDGYPAPDGPTLIEPIGVIERLSTSTHFTDDLLVREAIAWIHQNSHRPLQVSDVADRVGVSRRVIEQRFKKAINRSPGHEIRDAKVSRIKKLLTSTELSMIEISTQAGFTCQESFSRFFKTAVGVSPTEYRRGSFGSLR